MIALPLLFATLAAPVQIRLDQPGLAVNVAPLGGYPLCIWNDSALFRQLKPGMLEAGAHLFRFPNGSLSNEYQWNGQGRFDIDSTWIPSDTSWSSGFMGETRYRGTSKSSYGFLRPSLICDGDTNTFWWSHPEHADAPGWFYADFGANVSLDSVALWLGSLRPESVQVLRWTGGSGVYPGPHQQSTGWTSVARLLAGSSLSAKFSPVSGRYFAVQAIGNVAGGWQVREFQAFRAGVQKTSNVSDQVGQTQVFATSAHPGIKVRTDWSSNWDFKAFTDWIAAYPGADPMVCVNYGTGTPQNAAAWVKWANKTKGLGIRRWQVGNEVSGVWEEGGPVSARQYATRFVNYAKAMKAVDDKISVYGPVYPSDQFVQEASGDFDGRSWIGGFLSYLDSAEKADKIRYLDGIDFHTYPYWFSSTPDRASMLAAVDGNGPHFDSLVALMSRTIADPTSREILMTEYNTSTVSSSIEQEASGGAAAGLQLAHFTQRFGDRGAAILWELYEGGSVGPDGTFGTLSAFNRPPKGAWSNLGYPPAANFWTTRTLLREWLDQTGGDTVVPVEQPVGIRLFAVRNHGRISVAAFNLGADSADVSLDPATFASGDILSWGTGEFQWNGTDQESSAFPVNGPSSRPVPPSWNGSVRVPPFGMAVVRSSASRAGTARNASLYLSRQRANIGDTLAASGWSTVPDGHLTGGIWTVEGLSGSLVSTDGSWDGTVESWTARIPTTGIAAGDHWLRIRVGTSKDSILDSVRIRIDGSLRPVLIVSTFDAKKLTTTWGSTWFKYAGEDTATTTRLAADTASSLGSPYLKFTASIAPWANNYPNYATTGFPVPTTVTSDTSWILAGIAFDYRTTYSSKAGSFRIMAKSTPVKDYNDHYLKIPGTSGAWVHKTVLFSELHQDTWGKIVGDLDPLQLTNIEFRADGDGDARLDLDNLVFLGTKGASVGARRGATSTLTPLSLRGRELRVAVDGNWNLRIFSPDGRVVRQVQGRGATNVELARSGALWAVLESAGARKVLPIAPLK